MISFSEVSHAVEVLHWQLYCVVVDVGSDVGYIEVDNYVDGHEWEDDDEVCLKYTR